MLMMNEWSNIGIFADAKVNTTLKQTSYDDAKKEYMTESEYPVIDFDAVKEAYLLNKGAKIEKLKSADALVNCAQKIVFIEFKNGSMKNEKKGVKEKMKDSMFILVDLLDSTIEYVRRNVAFVVVYNKEKNSRSSPSMDAFSDIVAKLGHDRICRFGFDNYRELYFRKVVTYNDEQFNKDIMDIGVEGVVKEL